MGINDSVAVYVYGWILAILIAIFGIGIVVGWLIWG